MALNVFDGGEKSMADFKYEIKEEIGVLSENAKGGSEAEPCEALFIPVCAETAWAASMANAKT